MKRKTLIFYIAVLIASVSASDRLLGQSETDKIISSFEKNIEDNSGRTYTVVERMQHYGVPGMSIAVIRDGKLFWAKGYGVLQSEKNEKINTETVFSVGSVSKVGAATTTLRLVDQGTLDLNKNVNTYLTKWKVPENRYTQQNPVTLRGIMSHTAGLTVHGFADYQPGQRLPSTVQILQGSGPSKNGPVFVDIPVGSRFRYSGGGTTVEQLVIEEITNQSFPEAAKRLVFDPLKMNRSTYQNPIPETHGNIAKAHDRNGRARALPRGYEAMPESAASGLWTTPTDFSKLVIALMKAYAGEGEFISHELAKKIMTEVEPSEYGLGPRLSGVGENRFFSHGGSNDSYKAYFMGYLESQNGLIIFTNGNRGSELIREVRPAIIKAHGF